MILSIKGKKIFILGVASGHVTADQLVTQLKSVSVTPSQRDAITTVLKFLNRQHSQPLIPHRTTLTPSPTPQVSVHIYLYD